MIRRFRWRLRIRPLRASECERQMRRMTSGERGCDKPAEHLFR